MKLSMWMLADWLKKYEPTVSINEGKRILQNVRLFSEDRALSRTTVYLTETEQKRVICLSGHDMFVLNCYDIDQILNEILDAFEYYNDWAGKLEEMIREEEDVNEILNQCNIFHQCQLVLADATFYLYGNSDYFDLENSDVRFARENQILPLDKLLAISEKDYIRIEGYPPYRMEIAGEKGISFVRNLFADHKHCGWLVVICYGQALSRGGLDLLDAFGDAIEEMLAGENARKLALQEGSVFQKLLEGELSEGELARTQLEVMSWYPADRKQVFVVHARFGESYDSAALVRYLQRMDAHAYAVLNQNDVCLIVNYALTEEAGFREKLDYFVVNYRACVGVSPAFQNVFRIQEYYAMAKVACEYGQQRKAIFTDFSDVMLEYGLREIRKHLSVDICHPILESLQNYDEENKTELLETLRVFLEQERNYTEASKLLYIHRSTLIYRIHRIQEITGEDFASPDVRFHILLSYQLYSDRLFSKKKVERD